MHAALVQFKPRKGDVAANLATMREVFTQLAPDEPDLIVFPEAALTGYFLEGAVYELAVDAPTMAQRVDEQWRASGATRPCDVVIGFYENVAGTFHNSAIYVRCGEDDGVHIVHVHRKMFLPTYGVFDEERFLTRGRRLSVFDTPFGPAAILICEDAWHAIMPTVAALKGARLMIVPSASPGRGLSADGELESTARWKSLLSSAAAEHGVYVLYAGLTGFEGGKGMSGGTCAFSPRGDLLQTAGLLDACIVKVELDPTEVDLARA
ncbi:MAG: putative amidohydrolase, partial [Candidatus Eremiobacteraeota bacterium]|nr:putative amidohydrolase [Candidatus Eremiobacteraeota bacterium]